MARLNAIHNRTGWQTSRSLAFAGGAGALLALALCLSARSQASDVVSAAPAGQAEPAHDLAKDAVAKELAVIQYDRNFLRYTVHTRDSKGDQVRNVVESKDGTVARVISRDNRPLTAQEDADERARLQAMLDSPAAFQKHIDKDKSGKTMAMDLVKLMPDAMTFTYVPGQPQRERMPAGAPPELVLDFKPNPKWSPPTMTSQSLTGIEGRCWLDARTHHLTRLETRIFQGVNFGYGIFAHIYPGGELSLDQESTGDQRWMIEHFVEHATVRAMLVKTLNVNTDLQAFGFAPVPAMGYRDAIHLLLSTPLPVAGSASASR